MYSVYEIKNKVNGKSYIGITSRSIGERFEEHKSRARNDQRNSRLYAAMRKYGSDKFVVELLDQHRDDQVIRELESEYIVNRDTYNNGYNCNLGGCGFLDFPEDIKKKISIAHTGKKMSKEACQKMSMAKKENPTPENFGNYLQKGEGNPKAKWFEVQFPDGHHEIHCGLRAFCREYGISGRFITSGKSRGYILVERFNDYPEREYTQAGGSAHQPMLVEDIV